MLWLPVFATSGFDEFAIFCVLSLFLAETKTKPLIPNRQESEMGQPEERVKKSDGFIPVHDWLAIMQSWELLQYL